MLSHFLKACSDVCDWLACSGIIHPWRYCCVNHFQCATPCAGNEEVVNLPWAAAGNPQWVVAWAAAWAAWAAAWAVAWASLQGVQPAVQEELPTVAVARGFTPAPWLSKRSRCSRKDVGKLRQKFGKSSGHTLLSGGRQRQQQSNSPPLQQGRQMLRHF